MHLDFYTFQELLPLYLFAVLLLTSLVTFHKKKVIGLSFLFLSILSLGFFISLLDPFLTLWDEQFHALVAKNLAENPLKPMLVTDPVLPFDSKNWIGNHIWLHKQPFFLWCIALSIKLFDPTALAVRIPSIILHAFLPIIVYRIGKHLKNANTGFYAAIFVGVSSFALELVAGRHSTDHNDIFFLFLVTASFWAWFEYQRTKDALARGYGCV